MLKIHRSDGKKYAPYGYYGFFEDDFALPVADKGEVDQFCRDFCLKRTEEQGLSVIIPYPDKDINAEDIIRAVINQYFFPILSKDLVVTVRCGESEELLDAENLLQFVKLTDWPDKEETAHRLELAQWCIALATD